MCHGCVRLAASKEVPADGVGFRRGGQVKSRKWRLSSLLLSLGLLFAPVPGRELLGEGQQALVFYLGGIPLSVPFDRFLKALPAPAASPGGGGYNEMIMDDTKGKEKKASRTAGPGSFTIVRRLDASSPKLYELCAKGTHLPMTKWKNLVLKRGYISKYNLERSGAVAIEKIEIAYEGLEINP